MDSYTMTPADMRAVTDGARDDGFGMGGGWMWIIVLFLFLFGFGGGGAWGNRGQGLTQMEMQQGFDTQEIVRKLDGINYGLCDGFYAQNTNTMNGFAAVQSSLCQGFSGVNAAIVSQGYENRLGQNELTRQIADCCCTTQQNIKDGITQGIMNTNALQQSMTNLGFQSQQQHCDTMRAVHDVQDGIINYLNAQKMQDLRDENFQYKLAASQAEQNNYLVNQLRPCPIPAYPSCNPWAATNCGTTGCCGA